ncbi:MAG: ribonuclease P protein subunit [Thermoplasmata archaeon]|nr:ribonuclease P protein subunit [Thermoplasmata archaeon]
MDAPSPGNTVRTNPREERLALAGEILGSPVVIRESPGLAKLPLEGTIVDESLNLFYIRPEGKRRLRRVPKAGLLGTIYVGGRELPLIGENLRVRPEDRTKRILSGGRR